MAAHFQLLVNPRAGGGAGRTTGRALRQQFSSADEPCELLESGAPGELRTLAFAAAESGVRRLAIVGGDGSLNEVVWGLMQARAAGTEELPALAVFPVGTGNDYVKMLDTIPGDPAGQASLLRDGLARPVTVGLLDGGRRGVFINNAAAGFTAEATRATEAIHRRRGRRGGGRLRYVAGGINALLGHRGLEVTAEVDGSAIEGPFDVLHFGLGRYCGGGVDLTPWAGIDRPQLGYCLARAGARLTFPFRWLRLERGGGPAMRNVETGDAARVTITGEPFLIHADGELKSIGDGRLELSAEPVALSIIGASEL